MPTSGSSPVLQPGSPLSPKMASLLMPPQARRRAPRKQSPSNSLQLPSLPRYHPAHFQSQNSSAANAPAFGLNSPQPPVSPRSPQWQYSDAQRQLYSYQRELVATARGGRVVPGPKPASPRLIPLAGSPGPVTPLELENQSDGYLFVRAGSPSVTKAGQAEHIEKLIRDEAVRREYSLPQSSPRDRY